MTCPESRPFDLVGAIMAYEQGDLNDQETLSLFGNPIRSGQAWTLQGHYGRTARVFIDLGYLNADGSLGPNADGLEP